MVKSGKKRTFLSFRSGFGVGDLERAVAEHDSTLSQYYVGHDLYFARALSRDDNASVFIGPKGVGKSAVLQMIRLAEAAHGNSERVIEIRPDDLAFNALVNIQARSPLLESPRQNNFLFKSLWDYVLCVAILEKEHRDRHAIEQFLKAFFGGRHEKEQTRLLNAAIDDAGTKRSMTEKMLALVREIEVQGSFAGVGGGVRVSTHPQKATTPPAGDLNSLQLINSVARELPNRLHHDYYILIDDLDLHWQGTPLQNAFLGSLFFSIRKFSHSRKLKFVVSLRKKIFREVDLEERDKFADMVCEMNWTPQHIKSMIEKRLAHSLTVNEPDVWQDLFAESDFETIYASTDGMPREVIRLSIRCVTIAMQNGHLAVTNDDVRDGIRAFSESRLDDLASDQMYQLPGIKVVTRQFAGGRKEFDLEYVREMAFKVASRLKGGEAGELNWVVSGVDVPLELAKRLVRAGFLMVKDGRDAKAETIDIDDIESIETTNWYAIHPMYRTGLGLDGT